MFPAREFNICVSMCDFVTTSNSDIDQYIANIHLVQALNELGVSVDVGRLHFQYFNEIEIGQGDVYLYTNVNQPENIFVIDMYRELTDQMDIVSFSIRCSVETYQKVITNLRLFFDTATLQGAFEQFSYSSRLRTLIDAKKYPYLVSESGYEQKLFYI